MRECRGRKDDCKNIQCVYGQCMNRQVFMERGIRMCGSQRIQTSGDGRHLGGCPRGGGGPGWHVTNGAGQCGDEAHTA